MDARTFLGGSLLTCLGCMNTPTAAPGLTRTLPEDAAATEDVTTTSPEGAAARGDDTGTYHHGVSTCCGQGQSLTCCSADAGLLGYEVAPDGSIMPVGGGSGSSQANCFQYGGAAGACYPIDSMFDAKDACAICCAGLMHVQLLVEADGGAASTCTLVGAPSFFTCIPCGNGTCDPDENHCNCPADCP